MSKRFDYDKVIWGSEAPIRSSLFSSGSLILEGVLSGFKDVSGKVLEVGCGGGQFTRALERERPDLRLVGVDMGKSAIEYAKRKGGKISYIRADATKLPLKDESFDAIYSIEVLEHVGNYQKAISEMHRLLKLDGMLYLSVSCESEPWTIQGLLGSLGVDLTTDTVGHVNKFSYRELLDLLGSYGFKVKKRFYFGHLIRQLADFFYFLYLRFSKKKPGDLWAEYKRGDSLCSRFVYWVFQFTIFLTNLESKIFWWFPGISIQIEAQKK